MFKLPKIVVIGGSAGAITSLKEIVAGLPADFPLPICITVHVSPQSPQILPKILENSGRLQAKIAENGDILRAGWIYVAPSNAHLLVKGGSLELALGAKENRHRPAIDPLFRSAALAYGQGVVAVLLSGYLDDGSSGLLAVKNQGGTIVIQNPMDTPYPDMLRNALRVVTADFVLNTAAIAPTLNALLGPNWHEASRRLKHLQVEQEVQATHVSAGDSTHKMPGEPSLYSCPDCKGRLWQIEEDKLLRFRCHEGHSFSALSFSASQNEALEAALWTALRTLDDKVKYNGLLASRAKDNGHLRAAVKFDEIAAASLQQAALIRSALQQNALTTSDEEDDTKI